MTDRDDDLVALVDMDNSVADYELSMLEGLKLLASEAEIQKYGPVDCWSTIQDASLKRVLKRRKDYVKKRPGFFEGLPVIQTGMDVVALLQRLGYRLMVASKAPVWGDEPWVEKARWCRKHLPEQGITLTHDKSLMYGKVLFDDFPEYITAWLEHRPRGHVLMLDGPVNRNFEHSSVFRVMRHNVISKAGSDQLNAIKKFLATPVGPEKGHEVRNQFWETFLVHDPQDGVAGGCLCRCCKRRGAGTGSILHTMDCAAAELSKAWGQDPLQSDRPYGGVPE